MNIEHEEGVLLNFTKKEYIENSKFSLGMKEFYKNQSKKILVFHGQSDGRVHVSKLFLFFYHLLGYSFSSCYPKAVREKLGFGRFLWREFEGEMYNTISHSALTVFISPVGFYTEEKGFYYE